MKDCTRVYKIERRIFKRIRPCTTFNYPFKNSLLVAMTHLDNVIQDCSNQEQKEILMENFLSCCKIMKEL